MKIYVYAIARDEEKFAERWMTSMSEADGIYVLDTGSKDGTADKLRSLGAVVVREEFEPFRFDKARNRSLEFVPENADLCVCTDLDEEFTPGWRDAFERAASSGANAVKYRYVWNYLPDGKEGYVFWISKAHARRGFEWRHPVHEVVVPVSGEAKYAMADGVTLMHRPDPKTRPTTATRTIWAGSICSTADMRTRSRRSNATWSCRPRSGGTRERRRCAISQAV